MHGHIKQIAVYLIKLVFKLAHTYTHVHMVQSAIYYHKIIYFSFDF